MKSFRTSLALQLPLLAPLILLASLSHSSADQAIKKCDYYALEDRILQMPRVRVYEESMTKTSNGIEFRACTYNQNTAKLKLDCISEAAYVQQGSKIPNQKSSFLSNHAVSQLCALYES